MISVDDDYQSALNLFKSSLNLMKKLKIIHFGYKTRDYEAGICVFKPE